MLYSSALLIVSQAPVFGPKPYFSIEAMLRLRGMIRSTVRFAFPTRSTSQPWYTTGPSVSGAQ